jgi:hypothetical protein
MTVKSPLVALTLVLLLASPAWAATTRCLTYEGKTLGRLNPKIQQWEGRCRWRGREPAWEGGDTIPRVPLCPCCDGEVEELISTDEARAMLAAYETSRDPIEEWREALLDYLDAAMTWRADHRLQVGLEDVSLRAVLKG